MKKLSKISNKDLLKAKSYHLKQIKFHKKKLKEIKVEESVRSREQRRIGFKIGKSK